LFTLLNPAALLALAGLLVPVAIHLWNRRPGREVAVGSLRWLVAGANRRLRNLKLEQLWLLLLRAALLAVLAVAVAGPVWRTALPTSRGVVLLSAESAGLPALAGLKLTIDSLRRKGYALRWLAAGFPRVTGGAWQQMKAGQAGTTADSVAALAATQPWSQEFAWARVQQARAIFPGQPLFVVTSAALRNFQGSHATLPGAVTWQALPDTIASSWLQAATIRGKRGDSLRLVVGRSTASQTTFRTETIVNHNALHEQFRVRGLPPLRLDTLAGGGRTFMLIPARPGSAPATPIACGAPPQVIEIYATPDYAADARYLEAALRAASTGLLNPPVLRRTAKRPDHPADWTFWLSDEPLPKNWSQKSGRRNRIWRQAIGAGEADTAQFATTEAQGVPVTIFRRGRAMPSTGQPVWVDSRGRAVLSRQTGAAGTLYQLHTRLNPTWSTLADDPQLPARLLQLLQPEPMDEAPATATALDEQLARYDQRQFDPSQLVTKPETALPHSGRASQNAPATFRKTDLRPWLVLLAGLLLLAERLLARRRETLTLPATS
jgi:hypothetical protein